MKPTDLVRDELRAMARYAIPKPAGISARLDANESPYPLPAELAAQLGQVLAAAAATVNRYPDGAADDLRAVVASQLACPPAQLVFGNGSDELITLLVAAFSRPRDGQARACVAWPSPSFVCYRISSVAHALTALEVPLAADFRLDAGVLERALVAGRPNVIFFALPNNPTGTLWPRADIVAVCERHADTIVVADEAYVDYSGESMLDLLPRYPNLVVMRTLSKIGLAGLRCGFLVAHPDVVAEVEKLRPPYNLGSLNQAAACWLLTHHRDALRAHTGAVVAERERVFAALAALPGVEAFPSRANFVLFRSPDASARWQRLAARGVLVRNFDRPGPLAGCLRVTIGTPEENSLFLEAMRA